jgi:hypothetical protein
MATRVGTAYAGGDTVSYLLSCLQRRGEATLTWTTYARRFLDDRLA